MESETVSSKKKKKEKEKTPKITKWSKFPLPSAFIMKVLQSLKNYAFYCSLKSALSKSPYSDLTAKGITILGSSYVKTEAVS